MKERIAKWYKQGLWTAEMVQDAVDRGFLTADEAAEILSVYSACTITSRKRSERTDYSVRSMNSSSAVCCAVIKASCNSCNALMASVTALNRNRYSFVIGITTFRVAG